MTPKETYLSKPWLKYYPEGVPAEVEVREISVMDLFDQSVEKYGNRPALIFYGKKITYRELKDSVDRLATALADLGPRLRPSVLFIPVLRSNISSRTAKPRWPFVRISSMRIWLIPGLSRKK
jgi:hypothetical protein